MTTDVHPWLLPPGRFRQPSSFRTLASPPCCTSVTPASVPCRAALPLVWRSSLKAFCPLPARSFRCTARTVAMAGLAPLRADTANARELTRTQQCRVLAPISALTALDGDPAWLLGSARACGATASLQVRLGALTSTPCRASPRQTAAGPALRNRLTVDSASCMRMRIGAESSPAKCQALSAAQFCVGVRGKRGKRGVRSECGLASARQTPHLLTRRA